MSDNLRYERRWLAECIDPDRNHDKFYETFLIPEGLSLDTSHTVVFHWGRRGGKGQVQVHQFRSREAAESALVKKQDDKLREYRHVASDGPGYLSNQLMAQIEQAQADAPRWSGIQPRTAALAAETVHIAISSFVQDLLSVQSVTPAMVEQRSTFLEQMEDLKRQIAEAEATADLMEAVYRKRLA
jgi:predicted DNA-binding WGR domain protein